MTAGITWTFTDSQSQNLAFTTNTVTFPSVNIGTPAADRFVVIGFGFGGAGFGLVVNSFTLNGILLTPSAYTISGVGGDGFGIWAMSVPSGTTASIVITFNLTAANVCVLMAGTVNGSVQMVNQSNVYPSSFNPDPQIFATSVPVYPFGGGVVFLMDAPAQPQPVSWSPPTIPDFNNNFDSTANRMYGVAHTYTPGNWQPSVVGQGGGNGLGFSSCVMALATWQPSGLVNFVLMGQPCL